MNSILHLEDTALKLKALVTVMSATDSDNEQALQEMPIVSGYSVRNGRTVILCNRRRKSAGGIRNVLDMFIDLSVYAIGRIVEDE